MRPFQRAGNLPYLTHDASENNRQANKERQGKCHVRKGPFDSLAGKGAGAAGWFTPLEPLRPLEPFRFSRPLFASTLWRKQRPGVMGFPLSAALHHHLPCISEEKGLTSCDRETPLLHGISSFPVFPMACAPRLPFPDVSVTLAGLTSLRLVNVFYFPYVCPNVPPVFLPLLITKPSVLNPGLCFTVSQKRSSRRSPGLFSVLVLSALSSGCPC